MKTLLRAACRAMLPASGFSRLQQWRSRTHQVRYLREGGIERLSQAFVAQYGLEVRYGPFAGMRYTKDAAENRLIIPKLLGSFEQELHSSLETALRSRDYETVIDVGCAEGYYSTGFALRTAAQVLAFDVEPRELAFARGMACANRLGERVRFSGWCSQETLVEAVHGRTLILSDCEGYERQLFTEETVAKLHGADLLIELHGPAQTSVPELFRRTHQISLFSAAERKPSDYPELQMFGSEEAALALCEHRDPDQQWLWAEAGN